MVSPYRQSQVQRGHVIPQESKVQRKYEVHEIFTKQIWFDVVRNNVKNDAIIDTAIISFLKRIKQC